MQAVQLLQDAPTLALAIRTQEPHRGGWKQLRYRPRFAGLQDRPLVRLRQEARGEIALGIVGQAFEVGQDDKGRQVVAERAKTVGKPGSHAGKTRHQKPCVHHVAGRPVHVRLRAQRHQKAKVVDAARQLRKHATDPAPAFAVLPERERALHQLSGLARGCLDVTAWLKWLVVPPAQLGLIVKRVHLAHATVHEKLNDPAHLGGMVQAAVPIGMRGGRFRPELGLSQQAVVREQLGQGNPAQPAPQPPQKVSTGDEVYHA